MALVTSLVTQWMDTSEKQDEKVKIPMSDKILRMAGEDDDVLAQLVSNTNFFRCVMVQNIPEKFDDLALFELFMDFGDIEKIWIQERTKRNRHGRATIIFKNASDAEMAEAIMNETEVVDRTLQVHIGVPPSERRKASEKRSKNRKERKKKRKRENAMSGYRGRGRGRRRGAHYGPYYNDSHYNDQYYPMTMATRGRGGRGVFF
eukprot:556356_1